MSAAGESNRATFRLATYNVRHGLGDDGRVDLDRFATAVTALDADILALQEVEGASPRSRRANLPAIAATAMGAATWRFAPTLRRRGPAWFRASGPLGDPAVRLLGERPPQSDSRVTRGGPGPGPDLAVARYGIALASRYPVERWWRLDLPRLSSAERARRLAASLRMSQLRGIGPKGLRDLGIRSAHQLRDEPRAALAARIVTPSGALTVVATHLTALPSATMDQLAALVDATERLPGPIVLLGDLNLHPADVASPEWRSLADVRTHPVSRPVRQIDHILATVRAVGMAPGVGEGDTPAVEPVSAGWAVDTGLSDHRALVVDVRLG